MKNIPGNLENLKRKIDKLGVEKLVTVPVDLRKLKNDIVKKNVYNTKIKDIEDKKTDITNLANDTTVNAIK